MTPRLLSTLAVLLVASPSSRAQQGGNSSSLDGFTIPEIRSVYHTELRQDFGFPLTPQQSDEMWTRAKEFQYSVNAVRSDEAFPYLICTVLDGTSGQDRLIITERLLETASAALNYTIDYYLTFDGKPVDMTPDDDSDMTIPLEVSRNRANGTCFATVAFLPVLEEAATYEESRYTTFQPITPSMSMMEGTVDTIETILLDAHPKIKAVSLLIQQCPSVDGVDIDESTIRADLETYLSPAPGDDSGVSLVTQESFFAYINSDEFSAGEVPMSERMTFWSEALENGVEATGGCPDTLDRVQISSFYPNFFHVLIEKPEEGGDDEDGEDDEEDAFELETKALEGSGGYTDRECVWSVMASLAEMKSVCVIQIFYPISPGQSGGGGGQSGMLTDGGGSSGATLSFVSSKVAQSVLMAVGVFLFALR